MGYPNVGKSTILSVLTRARPKIANYHFTTLTPNLGMARWHGQDIVLADIPGIIEGASEGAGLGFEFLQHVERTRLLLHVVDVSGVEARDPVEDFDQINKELCAYGDLKDRPQIVVANKMDIPGAEENLARLKEHVGDFAPVFAVSAAMNKGFEELLSAVADQLRELPPAAPFAEEELLFEPLRGAGFEVTKEGAVFVVSGSAITQLVDSVNFENEESLNWFHRTMRRAGIIDALRKAGAGEGSTVRMDDMEFDFIE